MKDAQGDTLTPLSLLLDILSWKTETSTWPVGEWCKTLEGAVARCIGNTFLWPKLASGIQNNIP